ncbi:MAG: antibiotic biosynthesis monooxygenase [Leptolyngbya sp. DLM2.Bin27]|nr:MAG: antibiotic biosynthesis monooxygenase [Leptolyngbya sp. DLM2.Bin27]
MAQARQRAMERAIARPTNLRRPTPKDQGLSLKHWGYSVTVGHLGVWFADTGATISSTPLNDHELPWLARSRRLGQAKTDRRSAVTVRTISKLIARPGQAENLKVLLLEIVELAQENPGCLSFELLQSHSNAGEFVTLGQWQNDDAFHAHFRSGYMDEFIRELPDLVDHPPDIQWYTLVM